MRYIVVTQPKAEAEMAEAFHWIAQHSPINAWRWQNGLEAAIDSLDTFPERCTKAPESLAFGYDIRQLIHGQYRILFTIRDQTVHVLHVRHGARQPMKPPEAS